MGIPYTGVLLDSWWYFKGIGGGVKNWTSRPDVFTGGNAGIRDLVAQTGWKLTAHNRYWSSNTDYAKQNGGNFDFFIDAAGTGDMAVPLTMEFWQWLLSSSVREWGLTTYEQDWCALTARPALRSFFSSPFFSSPSPPFPPFPTARALF